MNKHKAKCDKLKKVRKVIADKLGVDLHQTECTYQGDCTGTCPKCKQEEEILNKEIMRRTVGVGAAGILALGLAGCTPGPRPNDIQGGMTYQGPEITENGDSGASNDTLSGNVEIADGFQDPEPSETHVETELSGDVAIADGFEDTDDCTDIEIQNEQDTVDTDTPNIPSRLEPLAGVMPKESSFMDRIKQG